MERRTIMLKKLLLKRMLASQLKDLPKEHQDKFLDAIEKNPELFQKIADAAQIKMKDGKDQMSALMEAAQEHQEELKKLLG